jgi:hypothetical protein
MIREPSHRSLTTVGQRPVSAIPQAHGVTTDPELTTCPQAAAQLRHGVDRLRSGDRAGAAAAFAAAVTHDPGFALGHAAGAVVTGDAAAQDGVARARSARRRISRRERQQLAIIELALTGRLPRASALGREHLSEFPDDVLVRHVLAEHCDDFEDLTDRERVRRDRPTTSRPPPRTSR